MPRVIKQVDEIAALRQHEIVYLEFLPKAAGVDYWNDNPLRRAVMELLDAEGLPHFPCAPPYSWESYIDGYFGHEYLDLDPETAPGIVESVTRKIEGLELSGRKSSVKILTAQP